MNVIAEHAKDTAAFMRRLFISFVRGYHDAAHAGSRKLVDDAGDCVCYVLDLVYFYILPVRTKYFYRRGPVNALYVF